MKLFQLFYTIFCVVYLTCSSNVVFAGTDGLDTATDNSGPDGNNDGSSDNGNASGDNNDGNNPQQYPQQQDPRQNMFQRNKPSKPVECFGIMGTGQNDNVFVGEDGHEYGYGEAPACHPQGSIKLPADNPQLCENIVVGRTEKGELIRGSLKPDVTRRPPETCYPYDFINKKITYMNPDYATPMQ
jgi:hypothetical protein